jgi:hypothetical protein
MTNESTVQTQIFDELVKCGWLVIRVNGGRRGRIWFYFWQCIGHILRSRGVSDLIGCTPDGRFFAIECKAPGKADDTSQAQEDFLQAVRERGGLALVADDVGIVAEIIENVEFS